MIAFHLHFIDLPGKFVLSFQNIRVVSKLACDNMTKVCLRINVILEIFANVKGAISYKVT